eukprot:TRINITY_DN4047_c2_g2_i1.p1 TRINITY_DN4047_c2_g2~~TRINITY_DN4047_c2_g2_i1.p1  ORF type:complete len:193 (-),score=41.88 TRINITY_DN4047_c2_g2_i1:228-806(-)
MAPSRKGTTASGNASLRQKLFKTKEKSAAKVSAPAPRGSSSQSCGEPSTAVKRLIGLFQARGVERNVAVPLADLLEEASSAEVRNLLSSLAKQPAIAQELNTKKVSAKAFIRKFKDGDPEVKQRKAADAVKTEAPRWHDGFMRIDCPECGSEDARAALFNSCAGAKPMLGRAQMVTRGECGECGNVWIKDER